MTVSVTFGLDEMLMELVRLIHNQVSGRHGFCCVASDPAYFEKVSGKEPNKLSCLYAELTIRDSDRALSLDEFSARFLMPTAMVFANSMILGMMPGNGPIWTSPWMPDHALKLHAFDREVPIAIALGTEITNEPRPVGHSHVVFGLKRWE